MIALAPKLNRPCTLHPRPCANQKKGRAVQKFRHSCRSAQRAACLPGERRCEIASAITKFKRYHHRGQQYSITALTDSNGNVTERYAYTAYGTPTITDGGGATLTTSADNNRYTYTGREWDETLSLYHYRARMYDSIGGRFLGRDPIAYQGSRWGLHEYTNGNPLSRRDPYGLKWGDLPDDWTIGEQTVLETGSYCPKCIPNKIDIFGVQYEDDTFHPKFEHYAEGTGLIPIYFGTADDLAQTANAHLEQVCDCVGTLELWGHSNPVSFGDRPRNGDPWGIWPIGDLNKPAPLWDVRWLSKLRFCKSCVIYLNGCNTGNRPRHASQPQLAQQIADITGCTVKGTRGYLYGTHAIGGERCERECVYHGEPWTPYPGAVSATNDDCWKDFTPTR